MAVAGLLETVRRRPDPEGVPSMAELEERPVRRGPGVLTIVVVVLAVIGLFSIIGTVMSAAWWLFKTAVIIAGLVVLAGLAWRLLIGKPDRA
jgi:hypothetical protein